MRNYRVCDSVEAYGLEKALDKACIDLDRVDKLSLIHISGSVAQLDRATPF